MECPAPGGVVSIGFYKEQGEAVLGDLRRRMEPAVFNAAQARGARAELESLVRDVLAQLPEG